MFVLLKCLNTLVHDCRSAIRSILKVQDSESTRSGNYPVCRIRVIFHRAGSFQISLQCPHRTFIAFVRLHRKFQTPRKTHCLTQFWVHLVTSLWICIYFAKPKRKCVTTFIADNRQKQIEMIHGETLLPIESLP